MATASFMPALPLGSALSKLIQLPGAAGNRSKGKKHFCCFYDLDHFTKDGSTRTCKKKGRKREGPWGKRKRG